MTVSKLREQLDMLLTMGVVREDDEIIVLGSGNKKTLRFDFVNIPVVNKCVFSNDDKGYVGLGFYRNKEAQ